MEKKLFLPDDEQATKLIENAWQDFCRQAEENGYDIYDNALGGLLKDCFVSGYCYGSNDMLAIIRDQLNAEYFANEMMEN